MITKASLFATFLDTREHPYRFLQDMTIFELMKEFKRYDTWWFNSEETRLRDESLLNLQILKEKLEAQFPIDTFPEVWV